MADRLQHQWPDHPAYAWLDGKLVPFRECTLHARSQAAFWGANVFEGVRAYRCPDGGMSLFRLDDHLARLERSMKCVGMPEAFSRRRIEAACHELLQANGFDEDVHIVIVAYFGFGEHYDPLRPTEDTGLHITALPLPRSPRVETGITAGVSSWRRISDETMPPRVKTGANYHNSRLAQHEALRNGYDTAILINARGTVAEGPGACLVALHGGKLKTPSPVSGILESITVATLSTLAVEDGLGEMVSTEIDRTELYLADEVMLCGTLAEIQPIVRIDGVQIGEGRPGPVTRRLQRAFDDAVRGRSHAHWSVRVGDEESAHATRG